MNNLSFKPSFYVLFQRNLFRKETTKDSLHLMTAEKPKSRENKGYRKGDSDSTRCPVILRFNMNVQYEHVHVALKSFCLRDWGRLGNEGWPISLKIGTQSTYVDLCNMPKFQLQRLFFSRVLDISPSGVLRG